MARINTKAGLRDYIKSQLGHPVVKIEVTNTQMDQIIDDTVQKFTEYAYGTLEDVVLVQINGSGEYDLPDTITNIIELSKGSTNNITNFSANFGSGFVPNLWSEQYFSSSFTGDLVNSIVSISATKSVLDKYFGDDLVYNFNHLNKKLQVLENFKGAAVVHYQYEYIANESNDLVYNHEWIKEYAKAKVKFLWGQNTGKYSQTLVGGATVNYSDMKSEAQADIDRLNEELLTKWSDPCPIDIA